ncbi:universal stress protein [Prauserella sp. ASG 168]|uniref:Universal stress protein n=1 Tax=Prauserella cavernicola TaxID=2800127 RepID=A0A934QWM0_9PSEU|nr:universal stress protein [Prauserella cavernicola]
MDDVSRGPIVVGTDGSESATAAVRWAARVAERRDRTLRIVHGFAYVHAFYGGDLPASDEFAEVLTAEARRILADARDVVKSVAPEVVVESQAIDNEPIPTLVGESRTADMVVLGSSGKGGFTGMLAGSTAVALASHAESPVVVVRGRADATGPVVVGVDGSRISERAVPAAFREASLRGVPLVAVNTWLDVDYAGVFSRAVLDDERDAREQEQLLLLAERLAGWQERYPDVAVERVVAVDRPRDQLLDRARSASLVVVGSRGRGGFRGLLLGSTSQALIHYAECPVMVVRPRLGDE